MLAADNCPCMHADYDIKCCRPARTSLDQFRGRETGASEWTVLGVHSQSKKKNRADSARFVVTERRYGMGGAWAGSKGWQNNRK
jgi:hypothetical protein